MMIAEIVDAARKLSPEERKELMKRLSQTFAAPADEPLHSILEFEGMAARLADDEDPQDFVSRLRREWSDRS